MAAQKKFSCRVFVLKSSTRHQIYRSSMTKVIICSPLQMYRVYLLTFFVLDAFVLKGSCQFHRTYEEKPWKCENVTIDFCRKMKYNVTHMPNIMNNANQVHAQMELVTYKPLVRIKCSSELELFLCSVYIPYCTEKVQQPIMACRTLCERVYTSCFPTMAKYGFRWPHNLNCTRFPPKNDDKNMCIDNADMGRRETVKKPTHKVTKPALKETSNNNPRTVSKGEEAKNSNKIAKPKQSRPFTSFNKNVGKPATNRSKETALILNIDIKSSRKYCRMKYLRNGQNYVFIEQAKSCALICNEDGIFTGNEKSIVDSWLTGLSYLCASLSLFALTIVVSNMKCIYYPERAIVYITFCYLVYSGVYIVRINVGRDKIGCDFDMGRHFTIQDGSGNIGCATTFLLTYLFSMAQSIWWVMMTLTWFLCGGMKWKPEAIRSCSVYFHVAAWGVPCGKTVIILMLRKIDVDELTGLCYVGSRLENISALRGFVVGPLFTYLIMGTTFLIAGFVALFKIRPINNCSTSEGGTGSKIEQPLLPIGIFAALHTILSTVILASYFYEYVNKESWFTKVRSPGANFEVFLLRLIMVFAVGLLSALWIICIHTRRTCSKFIEMFTRNNNSTESPAQLEPLRCSTETPV